MHVLLLALLATVTVNEVTLNTEIIENTEDQWIAPGYRIAEELVLDPGDYGTPLVSVTGNRNVIGFQPFFVDTPDGEKWRIILVFDGEVVVLQEDTEIIRFSITGDIKYMLNSANGEYVLLGLREDEQTEEELVYEGYSPPEHRVILLDIVTGEQVTATGMTGSILIGNDGSVVVIKRPEIEFYDRNLNLLGTAPNCIRQTSHTLTSYASDGSLLIRQFREHPDDSIYTLRAYDRFGNVLWDSYPPNVGWPAVSEHGEYVFVLTWGRLMCLNGSNGEKLWEEPHENEGEGLLMVSSRRGAAYAFETDVTPAEARENPMRERVLNVAAVGQDNNTTITRIAYQSDEIGFFSPKSVAGSGCSLWRVYFGERPGIDLSTYLLCLFSSDARLLYSLVVSEANSRFGNIWWNSASTALRPAAIDYTGKRIIWWDYSEIHILSIEHEGVSE